MNNGPELLGIWVKAPILKRSNLVIVAKCLKWVNPRVYEEFAKKGVVLENCPEQEGALSYGKIASIIRSSEPKKIMVVTIDGSPHCFTLQASVNEAAYILGESVNREHYVVVNGKEIVKIQSETIRVARYLSLVEKLVEKNPEVLEELEKLSKEHQLDLEVSEKKTKPRLISQASNDS